MNTPFCAHPAGIISFGLSIIFLLVLVFVYDSQRYLLRENSESESKAYSLSKVQMAWWTIIIFSSFIGTAIGYGDIPDLAPSTLILLGVSASTLITAEIIDASKTFGRRMAPKYSASFLTDIITSTHKASISRIQTVLINLIFGIWFILKVTAHLLHLPGGGMDAVIPEIKTDNLILLGISSFGYAALKIPENKQNLIQND